MATGRIGTTPVLTTRWSKAPAAGTTSLSGLDDNSVSLVYSVGYEAVYQNGVLLSRGNDYTATNGTTITLTTATVAGDIIEVFANQTIPLTDTYSQTVSDGRFIKNTLTTTTGDIIYASAANTPARLGIGSTDQVLKVSGGVPVWGAAPAGFSSFTDYTPTFTNFTLGNGTVTTQYATSGSLVWYQGRITIGSTSSFSGSLRISLPYQIITTFTDGFYYPMLSVGSGWDSSASTVKVATVRCATGTTLSLTSLDTNTAWATAQPWTWASDDRINFQVIYRSSEL